MLDMKPACERCSAGLGREDDVFICSYECTFCPACTEKMRGDRPNCAGGLLPRPRRRPK